MIRRFMALLVLVLVSASLHPAAAQSTPSVKTITLKNMSAYDMHVSPDGKTAALFIGRTAAAVLNLPYTGYTVTPDLLPIHLFDLAKGSESAQLTGNTDLLSDVEFSPDGKQVVGVENTGQLDLWNVASGKLSKQITGFLGPGDTVRFFPDGKTILVLLSGTINQFVVWNTQTGTISKVIHAPIDSFGSIKLDDSLSRLDYAYGAFDLSPDGKTLATATQNGKVSLWDVTTLKETVVQDAPAQKGMLNVRQLYFSHDGKSLIFFDTLAKSAILWDIASGSVSKKIASDGRTIAVSNDNKLLAIASNKTVTLINLDQPESTTKVLDFPAGALTAGPTMKFSADGSQLVIGSFYAQEGDNVLFVATVK